MIKGGIILGDVRGAAVRAVFLGVDCVDAEHDDTAQLTLINEGCP